DGLSLSSGEVRGLSCHPEERSDEGTSEAARSAGQSTFLTRGLAECARLWFRKFPAAWSRSDRRGLFPRSARDDKGFLLRSALTSIRLCLSAVRALSAQQRAIAFWYEKVAAS